MNCSRSSLNVLLSDVLENGFWIMSSVYANSKRVKIIEGCEVEPSPQSAARLGRI